MIRVYHVKNPRFLASTAVKMNDLHPVAEVNTHDLEMAWRLTNTIEYPWIDNERVKFLGRHHGDGCRSTSVGDVLERDGKFFIVDSWGFKPVIVV